MNRAIWLVSTVFALSVLGGCRQPSREETPAPSAPAADDSAAAGQNDGKPASAGGKSFGAPLSGSPEVALTEVLTKPETYADKSVTTKGYVRKACTQKGCWMEVAASQAADAPACRVTFKDYGFFVPLDAAGSTVTLEGEVEVKTIDKDEVEHMEAEGAKFAAKLEDGSAREVRFVASGVELAR